MMLVLAVTMLSACKTSSASNEQLIIAAIDQQCAVEFRQMVTIASSRAMTKRQVIQLIVDLDRSQKAKGYCGQLLISNLRAIASSMR